MPDPAPAISVQGLKKSYGNLEAVKGIDFVIAPGEVFGLLGPNGAGKTTTVEILEGLRPRSGGQVTVLGFDPNTQRERLKDRIGVCLQATNLPEKIRVHEAMHLFAAFYTRHVDLGQLLRRLQLEEKREAFYSTLSGGQKQRLALALALVNDPQLIFLDEPTTGLDPQVRVEIHSLLEELKKERRTILMTTHYIEEAERLCDRVAIVDEGRIIAMDTPRKLQQQSRTASSIVVTCATPFPQQRPVWAEATSAAVDSTGRTLTINSRRAAATLVDLVKWIDQQGLELTDVHLKQPTLEDVFIELTGKSLRE
ncbi:MAG TPA: ABC transporter ATP-binding protein [Terriglobales bacterium]|jgi:ABC-2 type transport system ATP-binding protein|nr:ABC transporter ATP-binding protein [Terriglobales bacterium]